MISPIQPPEAPQVQALWYPTGAKAKIFGIKIMKIHFEKVTRAHLDSIFSWLLQPHIMEFWDNTQAHKDDILNFAEGRKTPSSYADGKYVYWIPSLQMNHLQC
ncbi:MAG: hypothetical protein AB7F64_03445 [Gammaproteobacteria bacterium]